MVAPAVRTLIVDDHADVRFLIRMIVQEAGPPLEVVGEADGAESALARLDELVPDVVVMQARMPGLPIVLCSAWVDDDVRRRAAEAGIGAVLSKDQFDEIPAVVLALA